MWCRGLNVLSLHTRAKDVPAVVGGKGRKAPYENMMKLCALLGKLVTYTVAVMAAVVYCAWKLGVWKLKRYLRGR